MNVYAIKCDIFREKSEWMNGVMTEQLNFCKTNAEMWQEQSKVLSEYLKNGGMVSVHAPFFTSQKCV